jgi:NAD(P)-dependent dehydrogenase (short-subunit alcohol dehydrogenase family)
VQRAALALAELGFSVKEMLGGFECGAREGFEFETWQGRATRDADPLTAPVDTDYMDGDGYGATAAKFPAGRWGMPDDPTRLIAWPTTDEAEWITGQVIDSEGDFRR